MQIFKAISYKKDRIIIFVKIESYLLYFDLIRRLFRYICIKSRLYDK